MRCVISARRARATIARAFRCSACCRRSLITARFGKSSGRKSPTGICSRQWKRNSSRLFQSATRRSSQSAALGDALGFANVWIKNDGLNPSASLKDRASFLVVAEANRLKEKTIVTASTGNAASALAAVCAAAGKRALIFVPENAPKAKLAQMLLYGATVVPVSGTYDDAFRLSLEYTAKRGGLNRNTAYHPLTIEGKKTVGLEIWQQNNWRVPDAILVPTGDGVIISGVHKAFCDLKAAGLISRCRGSSACRPRNPTPSTAMSPVRHLPKRRAPGHDRGFHFRLDPLERAHGAQGGSSKAAAFPSR